MSIVDGRGAGGGRGPSRWGGLVPLTFLLPGVPQYAWRQRERGAMLAGSFATSMVVGLLAWGTRTGLALLAFAFMTQVVSAVDAIRQWSFPDIGRWVPTAMTSAGLALGVYGPLVLAGSLFAWPGIRGPNHREGYLVDRLAYRAAAPAPGERVWLGPGRDEDRGRLAEVLAGPGEEVEWSGANLQLPGRRSGLVPFRPGKSPQYLAFKVPEGRFLIAYRTGDPFYPRSWELVPRSRLEGRAWAQLYPVWERKLLN